MSTKKYKPEQIVNLLRQIEVEVANGKTTPQACWQVYRVALPISDPRWSDRRRSGSAGLRWIPRLQSFEAELLTQADNGAGLCDQPAAGGARDGQYRRRESGQQ
ncbi:MAG: hypothetical protein ABSF71_36030 [Terriglobia bacterium]|jgi:hypothetical protein